MTKEPTKTGKELELLVAQTYRDMGTQKVDHDVEVATIDCVLHRVAVEARTKKPSSLGRGSFFPENTFNSDAITSLGLNFNPGCWTIPSPEASELWSCHPC
jgi:hypothetical protein